MKKYVLLYVLIASSLMAMNPHERVGRLINSELTTTHKSTDKCDTRIAFYKLLRKKKFYSKKDPEPRYLAEVTCDAPRAQSWHPVNHKEDVKALRARMFKKSCTAENRDQKLYYAVSLHDIDYVRQLLEDGARGDQVLESDQHDFFGGRFGNILCYMAPIVNKYEEDRDEQEKNLDKRDFIKILEMILIENPHLLTQKNKKGLTPLDILEITHHSFKSRYPDEQSAYEIALSYVPVESPPVLKKSRRCRKTLRTIVRKVKDPDEESD